MWVQDYQLQLVPQMLRDLAARPAHRLLPPHPLPAGRALLPAAVAPPDPRGAARRRPDRLPAAGRGRQLRTPRAQPGGPQDPPRHHLPPRRSAREGDRVPDLDRHGRVRGAGPLRRRSRSGPPRSARRSATRGGSSWASTGSTTPRASTPGCAPSASWSRDGAARRRGRRLRAGRDALARARRAVPHPARRHRAARRADQRRPRPDRQARRSPTCTPPTPARRWPRSTGPPTSWWSRRSATG